MKNLSFLAVCNYFGSQRKTAQVLNSSPAFISHVVHGRRPMPMEWAPIIERESKGKFLAEELAPRVAWGVLVERGKALAEKAK